MKLHFSTIAAFVFCFTLIFSSCDNSKTNNNGLSETEPNNSISSASVLTISEDYDAKIDPISDIDFYKITASSDFKLTVAGEGTLEVRVRLYDQEQIQFFGEDAGTRGGTLTKTVSSSEFEGFVYVAVESAYGDDTGDYTIKFE